MKPTFVFHVVPWFFWKLPLHFTEIISLLMANRRIQFNCMIFKIEKFWINLRVHKEVTQKLFLVIYSDLHMKGVRYHFYGMRMFMFNGKICKYMKYGLKFNSNK